eukprot:CAMPEP_0204587050 /NCGR_PEP_ID=MMETSP0661-20131031/47829_1 /ASSEMBLY_ACC=CAM_ASM_000606 /TAXON_ID=109239 /ORGANISM="Alexandrium margalefi, Strain AMGDE01CS-322" /LENGTH=111 /DNA_ID=CAMNT_0051596735 /DNA_START=61 /DNA_END=396 /DNA_ORIENTATION=-
MKNTPSVCIIATELYRSLKGNDEAKMVTKQSMQLQARHSRLRCTGGFDGQLMPSHACAGGNVVRVQSKQSTKWSPMTLEVRGTNVATRSCVLAVSVSGSSVTSMNGSTRCA